MEKSCKFKIHPKSIGTEGVFLYILYVLVDIVTQDKGI